MWIERSVEERKAFVDSRRRNKVYLAIIAAIAVAILLSFLRSGFEAANSGKSYFVGDLPAMLVRLPAAAIGGVLVGVTVLFLYGRQSTMICASCGEAKVADCTTTCVCGGHFYDISQIKWIPDSEPREGGEPIDSTWKPLSHATKNKNA